MPGPSRAQARSKLKLLDLAVNPRSLTELMAWTPGMPCGRLGRRGRTEPDGDRGEARAVDFEQLVEHIKNADGHLRAHATKAVNASLTLRNWLIGLYLLEYEQGGSDRAAYGEQLLARVAERLRAEGMERAEARELRRYRQLYLTYPQIRESLTPESAASDALCTTSSGACPRLYRSSTKSRLSCRPQSEMVGSWQRIKSLSLHPFPLGIRSRSRGIPS